MGYVYGIFKLFSILSLHDEGCHPLASVNGLDWKTVHISTIPTSSYTNLFFWYWEIQSMDLQKLTTCLNSCPTYFLLSFDSVRGISQFFSNRDFQSLAAQPLFNCRFSQSAMTCTKIAYLIYNFFFFRKLTKSI